MLTCRMMSPAGLCRLQMGVETYTVSQIVEYPNSARQLERMTNINQVRQTLNLEPNKEAFAKLPNPLKSNPKIGLYKGFTGSIGRRLDALCFRYFSSSF